MGTEKHILVVEDEARQSTVICEALQADGLVAHPAFDGDMALRLFRQEEIDLVLLDINIPKMNGFDLIRQFRLLSANVPILMITAFSDIDSKMQAFDLGADDYLVKPIHLKELMAKVRVFLKRAEQFPLEEAEVHLGDLTINTAAKKVLRAGKEIDLTPKEYVLLLYLASHAGRVVGKDELAAHVWHDRYGVTANTVEVYISFLRSKVDKHFDEKIIHTKPGFGYYLKSSG